MQALQTLLEQRTLLQVEREDEIGQMINGFNRLQQINLRREEVLKESEAFARSILDSVDAEIAVLDHEGIILAVNEPWHSFATTNCMEPDTAMAKLEVGANYLAACKTNGVGGASDAFEAGDGIRAVLDGRLPAQVHPGILVPLGTAATLVQHDRDALVRRRRHA